MWVSSRLSRRIRVDEQPIELVDGIYYLGCTRKNDSSRGRDIQPRCAKANSAFNSLIKCPIPNEVKLRVYLSAIRSIMMYRSETWAAPVTVMEKLDCMERKLFRRLVDYFWQLVRHNEERDQEVDVVYRLMTRGKRQHLVRPPKVFTEKLSSLLRPWYEETIRPSCSGCPEDACKS
ncbi:hypothetical protein RB195_022463 [Necator americanus]|uniref:Reverse transcriptase n=1 Tax=Necator americanus TaxID=51031 RepID=A0ABR1EFD9_NECAM